MEWTLSILDQYGKLGVDQIKKDLAPYSKSGKTVDSVHYEAWSKGTVDRLVIMARAYISTMETGRGPRTSSEYGGFDKGLESYLNDLNLQTKTSKGGIKYYKLGEYWFSAKSLAWKINKEGDKTYRAGGRTIYTPTVDALVDAIKKSIRKEFKVQFTRTIKNIFVSLLLLGMVSCGSVQSINGIKVKEKKQVSSMDTFLMVISLATGYGIGMAIKEKAK